MLCVGTFHTEEEAIKLANDTTYGLGAGLHSSTCPSGLFDVSPISFLFSCYCDMRVTQQMP